MTFLNKYNYPLFWIIGLTLGIGYLVVGLVHNLAEEDGK